LANNLLELGESETNAKETISRQVLGPHNPCTPTFLPVTVIYDPLNPTFTQQSLKTNQLIIHTYKIFVILFTQKN